MSSQKVYLLKIVAVITGEEMMRVFDVFDQWGNKTGEIHADSVQGSTGLGCVFSIVLTLAIVMSWPALIAFVLGGYAKGEEVIWLLLYLALYLISSIVNTVMIVKKATFSFVFSWIKCIFLNTAIVGGVYWIIGGIFDHFSISVLFSALFLSFLLSVVSSFICSIIAALVRKKRLNKGGIK